MKKNIMLAILAFPLAGVSPQAAHAQGTVYVSSLGLPSTGSASVGSDSWLAADFGTGTNAGGYLLNSVQLALTNASGNPSGFTAMIYNVNPKSTAGAEPGSSLGTLNGSLEPVAGGIYTYSPASGLTLSPTTEYFIVLTAGTAVANGAYEWSYTSTRAPTLSGGWNGDHILLSSSDGLRWGPGPGNGQFAISATDVPEPSTLGLLAMAGFFLVRQRRKCDPNGPLLRH
jgi:hypothetical protein